MFFKCLLINFNLKCVPFRNGLKKFTRRTKRRNKPGKCSLNFNSSASECHIFLSIIINVLIASVCVCFGHRIHSICFHPEGIQLIVGASDKVLVYEPNEGTLIDTLTGHKDTVYTVGYSFDGKKFASGGADKCVIVWNNKLDGVLKYS